MPDLTWVAIGFALTYASMGAYLAGLRLRRRRAGPGGGS